MSIKCQAALNQSTELEAFHYTPISLAENEVEIEITHCGICHSDIHLIDNDWGFSEYPMVPGHEIVGTVKTVGSAVKHLQVGMRVGVGWQCGSCHQCEWCMNGEENLCQTQSATCVGRFGGFADRIHVDAHFAFELPESLDSATAAPLFCGGATVFSPLKRYIHTPKQKIGVIGLGGLGHLAVQFAHALGNEVTVFSSTKSKATLAYELGADHFIDDKNPKELEEAINSLDFIISTVPTDFNWQLFLDILRPKGILCFVGVFSQPITIPDMSLIIGRKTICGSNIASCPEIREMLKLAAEHNIFAHIETFPMHEVNQAIAMVKENQVRFRAVLEN